MADALHWSKLQNWNGHTKVFTGVIARVSPPFIISLFLNLAGGCPTREKLGVALAAAHLPNLSTVH